MAQVRGSWHQRKEGESMLLPLKVEQCHLVLLLHTKEQQPLSSAFGFKKLPVSGFTWTAGPLLDAARDARVPYPRAGVQFFAPVPILASCQYTPMARLQVMAQVPGP